MKRWLPFFAVIAGLAVAGTAFADNRGLNLSWNDCGSFGVANQNFACDTNSGTPFQFFASFVGPDSIQTCVSLEFQLDLIFPTSTVQPWWQLRNQTGQTGQCRNGALSGDANFVSGPFSCADVWAVAPTASVASYTINPFGTQSNRVRLVAIAAVGSADAAAVTPGTEYYAMRFTITKAKTVGTGSCTGCTDGACVVLNRIGVIQPNGTPGGNQQIYNEAAGGRRSITWQSGTGADCNLVPTRTKTWGQIKALYR